MQQTDNPREVYLSDREQVVRDHFHDLLDQGFAPHEATARLKPLYPELQSDFWQWLEQ